jgi:hypothetical protein
MKAASSYCITLRAGMVAANHSGVKLFTSETAFQGYVSGLRAHGVVVSFATPFAASCQGAV